MGEGVCERVCVHSAKYTILCTLLVQQYVLVRATYLLCTYCIIPSVHTKPEFHMNVVGLRVQRTLSRLTHVCACVLIPFITEVALSAYAYRLFHEDFSSIVRAKFSTCDSRTNLNHMIPFIFML